MSMSCDPTDIHPVKFNEAGLAIEYEDWQGNKLSDEEVKRIYDKWWYDYEKMREKYSKPQYDEDGNAYSVEYS